MNTEQRIMCHTADFAKKAVVTAPEGLSGPQFVYDCMVGACDRLREPLMLRYDRNPKAFIQNAAEVGRGLIGHDIEYAKHGGLIVWNRRSQKGKWHLWKSHIAIWHGYDIGSDTLYTVEISDGLPALCEYPKGSWRKGLYMAVGF